MKLLTSVFFVGASVLGAPCAWAIFGVGDVVFDPATEGAVLGFEAKSLEEWSQNAIRFEQQMEKTLEQIEKAKQMIDRQDALIGRVGDWKKVYDKARSIQMRIDRLGEVPGRKYNALAFVDYGQSALHYRNHGQYADLVTVTESGTQVKIDDGKLKRYAAMDNLHDDVVESFDQSDKRIKEIEQEIADTAEDLAKAETQAETEKLMAKLQSLKIALDNVRAVRQEKIERMMATKAINDSQTAKEAAVAVEVQAAEAREQLKKWGEQK